RADVGTATATVKHRSLDGQKLLVVQPYGADGVSLDGDPQLAIDACGAGKGDPVIITSDGKFASAHVQANDSPVRWSILAIIDAQTSKAEH
ncbi:MAG: EutN/CcmL family microcompartment protein, partial [Planctomycetota bacterium]